MSLLPSGKATDCRSVKAGSSPVRDAISIFILRSSKGRITDFDSVDARFDSRTESHFKRYK